MKLILVQPQLCVDAGADNIGTVRTALETTRVDFAAEDIVVLPEGVDRREHGYEADVTALARSLGCHVVGGSRRETVGNGTINAGLVFDNHGTMMGRYEKLRPYASERQMVRAGTTLGEFTIGGRNLLVLICADFWFADLFQRAARLPDLVLVAALSVTRKTTPDYSRTLWRHLAIARAYEFAVYVGISDWGYPSGLDGGFPCGVGGFADPTATAPERFFTPIGDRQVAVFEVDFATLDAFRHDRTSRGFFWKSTATDALQPRAAPRASAT